MVVIVTINLSVSHSRLKLLIASSVIIARHSSLESVLELAELMLIVIAEA